jgi:acyl carrier protein
MVAQADLSAFVCSAIGQACNCPVEAVTPSTPLVTLNIDSLTLVALVAQVEAIYGVDLSAEELISLTDCARVSDFVDRLKELMGARAA